MGQTLKWRRQVALTPVIIQIQGKGDSLSTGSATIEELGEPHHTTALQEVPDVLGQPTCLRITPGNLNSVA